MSRTINLIKQVIKDILLFSQHGSGITLRQYQTEAAIAIVDSVINHKGLHFVVMFPRQSGKNELQTQIEAYLLLIFSEINGEIVKVSPTWKPQSLNAMRRLERTLGKNFICQGRWEKERDYIYKLGSARIYFLSGQLEANVVGATASTLLEVDEAQDVLPSKFDKDIAPMAASTNATQVFWGTAWTSTTLLARELRAARAAESRDGIRRAFVLAAPEVGVEVEDYGKFVAEQVARLGRNHPMVKTQFFSEEVDSESGMFPAARRALMQGTHPFCNGPETGKIYAFLVDVAGEDEGKVNRDGGDAGDMVHPERDLTVLTIVEIDLATVADQVINAPTYRVVNRQSWQGDSQVFLYGKLKSLAADWNPRYLVMDATGIGAGLASFMHKAVPGKVLPYVFNSSTKSKLGWDFISVIETGRFKDGDALTPALSQEGRGSRGDTQQAVLKASFDLQLERCQLEVIPGPGKKIRWGVPEGTRDSQSGELVHDDLILSAALCAVLDEQEWTISGGALIVRAKDVLEELDRGGY